MQFWFIIKERSDKMDEKEYMNSIRERISNRRNDLGLSYQALENKTGISRSTLQRYEKGSIKNIPLDKLPTLAEALAVSPSYLMNWENTIMEPPFPVNTMIQIPIVKNIHPDRPILDSENIQGYESIDPIHLCNGYEYFYFIITNDTMKDVGLFPEDKVLIQKQNFIMHGELAAVLVNHQEIKIRRILKQKNITILKPENSSYHFDIFTEEEQNLFSIIGKVILSIHYPS